TDAPRREELPLCSERGCHGDRKACRRHPPVCEGPAEPALARGAAPRRGEGGMRHAVSDRSRTMASDEVLSGRIEEEECFVRIEEGRLFAKTWTPDASADRPLAPIVLFHDSLGSVELWRSFPRQLALTTGRRVIAYDRLGFGRSDPYPGR